MTSSDLIQFALYAALLIAVSPFLGRWLHAALTGGRTWLSPVLNPVEKGIYAVCGVDPAKDQDWRRYAGAMLLVNLAGFAVLYLILRTQHLLPFNPQSLPGLSSHLAFNTAMSFASNTNWQAYGGETTMSYFSQMVGLTVQNFLSPATGIAVLLAMIRGFTRRESNGIGNFYVDMTRSVVHVLLPLSLIMALFLVWQGMPQNLSAYVEANTVEGAKQIIAQGPVASQVAIKQLGTNGGGFFNVNSAHPYENPTPLTNFVEMFAILALAAALVFAFGHLVKDKRQAWALFWAMFIPFIAFLAFAYWAELQGNPFLAAAGVDPSMGNMEGKEVRFGVGNSVLWATATTAASNGSVNAMHDSFTALGGLVPLVNMMLGEVIFGGVGSGLYGMLVFAILTVFIAGLMVGRTPEYLGKKIESTEVKFAILAILIMPIGILISGGVAMLLPQGVAGLQEAGSPHGFTELLYAYTSATANNGSAFAGLTANTPFTNPMLGMCMWLGRYGVIVPVLAIAGSLAAKKIVPASSGTFPTHGALFVGLLIGVIFIVGALTFFPVLALGPLAEHFSVAVGTQF
ncbi:MAG: potassium-transporting ATPase subunit KdpA [Sinimarinibacterium sp.]|jgi:K+-transporting ATPase ATPase A chain